MEYVSPEEIKNLALQEWGSSWGADEASKQIEKLLLQEEVKEKTPAVLFSGGLDSALIACTLIQLGKTPELYVFAEDQSSDLFASQIFANRMGLKIHIIETDDIYKDFDIEKVLRQYNSDSVHHLSMAILNDAVWKLAHANGVERLWTGSGADLIFAGDKRPEDYGDPKSPTWRQSFKEHQLATWYWRFSHIDKNKKLNSVSPLGRKKMMDIVTHIDPDQLFSEKLDKMPLRLLADRWGMPEENAWRPKEMAQRGSGLFRFLEKEMMKDIDELTNLRVSHNRDDYREDSSFLALRIWIAWMAERAGVKRKETNQSPLPLSWDEVKKELDL
jgi:asparagine synthetase B (glutamine-hydrolysing)